MLMMEGQRLFLSLSLQIKGAQIVIASMGKPKFVQGSWLKDPTMTIDCSITSLHNQSVVASFLLTTHLCIAMANGKSRLFGDVHVHSCQDIVSSIISVLGEGGPITMAMFKEISLSIRKPRLYLPFRPDKILSSQLGDTWRPILPRIEHRQETDS